MSGIRVPGPIESAICVSWAEALGLCDAVPVLGVGERVAVIPSPSTLQAGTRDAVLEQLQQNRIREREILDFLSPAAPRAKPRNSDAGLIQNAVDEVVGTVQTAAASLRVVAPVATAEAGAQIREGATEIAEGVAGPVLDVARGAGDVIAGAAKAAGDFAGSTSLRFGVGVGLAALAALAVVAWVKS